MGWGIRARAPRKRVNLELGNNAPVIIEPGTDIQDIAKRISVAAGVVHIIILQNFVFEPDEMSCSFVAIMPRCPTNALLLFMNAS